MKKKLLAILLTAVLSVTMLAGCGNEEPAAEAEVNEEATEVAVEPKEYSIAVPFPESGNVRMEILRANMDILEEKTNGTYISAATGMTPDEVLSFVESQVAAGVDGLIICPPSDSILPTVTQICEDAGVYWGITWRSINDPEIRELVEASPYYVGNCFEDEETAGYICGKWMGEQGYKKIAIISQAKGDTTCDAREVGLGRACEEYGIEIVGESRGQKQASDTTAATESFLAANADLDAIFFVGSTAIGSHEACMSAIQAVNSETKVVSIDFPDEMAAGFEAGTLAYSYAQVCLTFDPYITLIKVMNAVQGTPLNEDGLPTSNSMAMFGIDNYDDAMAYSAVTGNSQYQFFNEKNLEKLFKWKNPDLNEATLQEMLDNYEINE